MPAIDKPCSISNAFNFRRDVEDRIGHIISLTIGDTALTADITIKNPTDESDVAVVGIISHCHWDGGTAEPIQFSFNVSITNKNEIATLLHTTLKSVKIIFKFNVYEYDKEKKEFFNAFHCNDTDINALLQTQGSERVLFISDQPAGEVQKPENYQATMGLVPEDQAQSIHMAVAVGKQFVKPWGVARA